METQTQLPLEVQPDARSALRASASGARVALVRAVEQDVKRLTRAANNAKRPQLLHCRSMRFLRRRSPVKLFPLPWIWPLGATRACR